MSSSSSASTNSNFCSEIDKIDATSPLADLKKKHVIFRTSPSFKIKQSSSTTSDQSTSNPSTSDASKSESEEKEEPLVVSPKQSLSKVRSLNPRKFDSLPLSPTQSQLVDLSIFKPDDMHQKKRHHRKRHRHHHKNHQTQEKLRERTGSTQLIPISMKDSPLILPKMIKSLHPFENTKSEDEDIPDTVNLPLSQLNPEATLVHLFNVLNLPEEVRESLKNLNNTPFPKDNEWIWNDDKSGPSSASFNQLILFLTQPDTVNIEFQKQFLMLFPSFATPSQVLAAIFQRFFADLTDPYCNIPSQKKFKNVRDRIIRILSTWMKLTSYQFTDQMLIAITDFTNYIKEDKNLTLQSQILNASVERVKGKRDNVEYTYKSEPPAPILPNLLEDKWTILNISPIEIARQVTLHHSEIFRNIGVMELLSAIWGQRKGGGSENVDSLTKHFDLFSRYVQFSIVNGKNPSTRAKIFQWWVEVAIAFREMNNFHGVYAVICGITHRSVERMTDTMKQALKMTKKLKRQFEELKELCDFSRDYANYRPVIAAAIEPCIPFIGCFQKDLIYVQEGFPNNINGLTNFKKCAACISLIKQIERFQNERYSFIPNKKILELITSIPEPPDTVGIMKLSMAKEKKK
ncbi:RasGEF domain containing protein [Tritrichomonas foetus]|uniref:RasGEF domain containing protein n=1 Tax=Tritrichomonas foetus TaxID=1144522 RepID=A0A1J4KV25_9EUKA|nr:RasGEF domain containing protein [Tritrichomonas foetus]|eukprot:OHT15169.1 RasGEF domain containing protein [Tritrichomonas foetus]